MSEEPRGRQRDPNYILSQEEFHGSLNESEIRTQSLVRREVDGLRESFGWIAISLACWLAMIGLIAVRGNLRGGPRG